MTFGKWLAEKRKDARLTQTQLAERVGISANYVSALERDEPNARDGSPRRMRVDKVDKLARVLHISEDEARLAAGYAPLRKPTKPTTLPELIAALTDLGIETPQMFGGLPSDPGGEGFREVIERIWLDIQLVTNRMKRGRAASYIVSELPLHEIDTLEDVPITELKKTS